MRFVALRFEHFRGGGIMSRRTLLYFCFWCTSNLNGCAAGYRIPEEYANVCNSPPPLVGLRLNSELGTDIVMGSSHPSSGQ